MKILLLARHAKSSWNAGAATDFERPLNDRGLYDAQMMGVRLADHALALDEIVSSTANRAITTARMLADGLNHSKPITQTADIYEASSQRILQTIASLADDQRHVMLVGHNPGMSNTCNTLCSTADIDMPSGAIACLELDIDQWAHHYPDCATLRWYDYPKKR